MENVIKYLEKKLKEIPIRENLIDDTVDILTKKFDYKTFSIIEKNLNPREKDLAFSKVLDAISNRTYQITIPWEELGYTANWQLERFMDGEHYKNFYDFYANKYHIKNHIEKKQRSISIPLSEFLELKIGEFKINEEGAMYDDYNLETIYFPVIFGTFKDLVPSNAFEDILKNNRYLTVEQKYSIFRKTLEIYKKNPELAQKANLDSEITPFPDIPLMHHETQRKEKIQTEIQKSITKIHDEISNIEKLLKILYKK